MPRPVEPGQRYVPGLDGIRAVAVLCVIAYHINLPGAGGGLLGVGVFFTLSGYLITDLLLSHAQRHGHLGLGRFWIRRARRLLPALFVMLVVASVWVALFDASQLVGLRPQVYAAAGYFSNWSTIAQQGSYFGRFASPLPLDHLWSLAIEEQFYLIWPWLLMIGIWTLRRRRRLAWVTLAAAGGSALAMALLYHPGYDPTRVYEGTDTRAFGLLIGAALAMRYPMAPPRRAARARARMVNLLDLLGILGLVCVVLLVSSTDALSSFLYPTGFLLLSLATAALILAVVNPVSRFARLLGCRPLRWVGVRSYGMYLWQWPVIVLASHGQTGFHWFRAALEVAGTFVISALSWRYVEEPVRRGALGALWRQARSSAGRLRVTVPSWTAAAGLACLVLPALALAGQLPVLARGGASGPGQIGQLPSALSSGRVSGQPVASSPAQDLASRTACTSVVYIGDSTSEGETSNDYIPNPALRLPAQLADVGVRTTIPEISTARSIIETFQDNPNAATVAQQQIQNGFRGCWILALGTNEVDNVHDGGPGYPTRVNRMMSVIGNQPVLWVAAVTLLPPDDPYSEQGMQAWNQTLLAACPRYPNMRVFDWPSYAQRRWFIPDGIHYYSPGYVARSRLIARALAHAFPAGEPPNPSCIVR